MWRSADAVPTSEPSTQRLAGAGPVRCRGCATSQERSSDRNARAQPRGARLCGSGRSIDPWGLGRYQCQPLSRTRTRTSGLGVDSLALSRPLCQVAADPPLRPGALAARIPPGTMRPHVICSVPRPTGRSEWTFVEDAPPDDRVAHASGCIQRPAHASADDRHALALTLQATGWRCGAPLGLKPRVQVADRVHRRARLQNAEMRVRPANNGGGLADEVQARISGLGSRSSRMRGPRCDADG